MPRRCNDWLKTFLEWTLPRSEAPESLLVWSGLFCLAAVTKRNVYFPARLLGSYDIFPSLYLIFIGPPGVVRKSTTAGYVDDLVREMIKNLPVTSNSRVHLGPTAGSHSKLLEMLTKSPDGSMTVISSEFGNLVSATPEGMYDVLTHLFDNPADYEYATRMHGREKVIKPSFNLLGCTTPGWIAENTGYMIHGGFASRVIFVFEQFARQRKMYYDIDQSKVESTREKLVKDLFEISELEGEFSHETPALRDRMERWYIEHSDKRAVETTEGFHSRKHVHVHKVAMLLSLAERSDLVITEGHFEGALVLLDDVEKKMSRGLSVVGRNPYSADLYRILDFIQDQRGPVPKRQILAKFWHDLQPEETAKILEALLIAGEIRAVTLGDNLVGYELLD